MSEAMDLETVSTRSAEAGEAQIDAFISRMDTKRRDTEGERAEEELYAESVRRYNEQRHHMARLEWHAYHTGQAERHRRTLEELIARHEAAAERLLDEGRTGENTGAA
jgi:hypothetical protein